ncbi:MAG TPA: hypothetical protein VHM19_14890 [Polyangiales bacterium]|nr:hypothetical protein [Polyangiales bacterium]
MSIELLREKLHALAGVPMPNGDVIKLLNDLVASGGGITLDLDDGRWKLIRRDGRFVLKKEEGRAARPSTLPPRRE